jgi:hypothetical protein
VPRVLAEGTTMRLTTTATQNMCTGVYISRMGTHMPAMWAAAEGAVTASFTVFTAPGLRLYTKIETANACTGALAEVSVGDGGERFRLDWTGHMCTGVYINRMGTHRPAMWAAAEGAVTASFTVFTAPDLRLYTRIETAKACMRPQAKCRQPRGNGGQNKAESRCFGRSTNQPCTVAESRYDLHSLMAHVALKDSKMYL